MKRTFVSLRHITTFAAVLFAGMSLLTACKKDSGRGEQTVIAGLMAFNLAPDQNAMGITLSGNPLLHSPLIYTGYTGGYLNIYPGNRTIVTYSFQKDSALTSSSFDFIPGKYHSLFVVGSNGNYKNVVAQDNFDSLSSTSGQAYIRYVNAVPDSSALNVSISVNGSIVSQKEATFATVSDFIPVAAGNVKIALAGGDVIAADRTIRLESGKAYTALLVGLPSATDTTQKVQIRYVKNAG